MEVPLLYRELLSGWSLLAEFELFGVASGLAFEFEVIFVVISGPTQS